MQNERGQPPEPYDALDREIPEDHPIDATVERRVLYRTTDLCIPKSGRSRSPFCANFAEEASG
jgi:hypothetical protein